MKPCVCWAAAQAAFEILLLARAPNIFVSVYICAMMPCHERATERLSEHDIDLCNEVDSMTLVRSRNPDQGSGMDHCHVLPC